LGGLADVVKISNNTIAITVPPDASGSNGQIDVPVNGLVNAVALVMVGGTAVAQASETGTFRF